MKRLFKYMLCLLVVGLTMVSCSKDDTFSASPGIATSDRAINYSASAGTMLTRGIATTSDNYLKQIKDFQVRSYFTSDNSLYIGTNDNGTIRGTTIFGDGNNNWSKESTEQNDFWPKDESLDFYAITPATNNNYSFNGGNLTYTVPAENSAQVDVMVAKANNQSINTNNGIVDLNFEHVLSQMRFKLISDDVHTIIVKSIKVHNLNNVVPIQLSSIVPDQPSTSFSDYTIKLSSPVSKTKSTEPENCYDDDGVLLVAPQDITGWEDKKDIDYANTNHETYLEIECQIKKGDKYILGGDGSYERTYVPLSGTIEAGKCYTYILSLNSGGKNHNGDFQLSTIKYSVQATEWTNIDRNVSSYEAVDLGLPSGTKWCNKNLGASTIYDLGSRYAFGEVETKDIFTDSNYRFGKKPYTKYNSTDNLTELEPEDDAATVNLGSNWKIPTENQLIELNRECKIQTIKVKNISYLKFTGPNGNYILMPYGNNNGLGVSYASSQLVDGFWATADGIDDSYESFDFQENTGREAGCLVRPVSK